MASMLADCFLYALGVIEVTIDLVVCKDVMSGLSNGAIELDDPGVM